MKQKRNRKSPVVDALEQREGKPFAEIVAGYAARGYSRKMTARELGIHPATFACACRRMAPHVQWPGRNDSIGSRSAYQARARSTRAARKANGSAHVVEYRGKQMTLGEAAECSGIDYNTLYARYRQGRPLFVPVQAGKGRGLPLYDIGWSVRDLSQVVEFAREHGVRKAVNKFGIPQGAISAMLRGEWERVA